VDLAPELSVELEEHRPQPVREDDVVSGDDGWHSLTRLTNRPPLAPA
jgi:hypothetical protein